MPNSPDFSSLPESLHASTESLWQQFVEKQPNLPLPDRVAESLPLVWCSSEFIARQCLQHPTLLSELCESGDLLISCADGHYADHLHSSLEQVNDEAALHALLRQYRRREMVRIMWRDIAGWAELQETTRDLSLFAEACIDKTLEKLYQWQCEGLGTPMTSQGSPQQMVVLGMGKLGAWELNVSSDIDLIFVYPDEGQTEGGARQVSSSEFFNKLGQKLIKALGSTTVDGYVFRVDMRLRPFGDGGPLVSSFDAFEHYYQVHGREWERYAMIKARVVGGDRAAGEELMAMLRPFIYRRYLDYGAYESLREMKEMIAREVKRKGVEHNVKLGAGGIREVEFIGQVFQLIRGGREPALQERRLLKVLHHLQEDGILPDYVVRELSEAYVFLRHTEHRLQEFADQQTHLLPDNDTARSRLAFSMGFADWASFSKLLQKHRERVQSHFEQVFEAPQTDHRRDGGGVAELESLWQGSMDGDVARNFLARLGFNDPDEALRIIHTLRDSRLYRNLSQQGQSRMDKLVPLLLGAMARASDRDTTFARVMELVTSVAKRSVYLALLVENPLALSQLIRLFDASPWLARYVTRFPLLLDDLLDPATLYAPPQKAALVEELRQRLLQVEAGDDETAMDVMRQFRHTNVLRVAAADISGALPIMKVSDHLSWIAETVLEEALELAWQHLIARHGRPVCDSEGRLCDKGFAIVGYGKLGGLELGYGSDLDMVFLHGAQDESAMTTGKSPVALPVFFARLGQRLIHLLSAHTPSGTLYEVDMRLRPDGASGMLVSNLDAFRDYQDNKAWVWEHQALVRARVVAGDPLIAERFAAIRQEVLCRERNRDELRAAVIDMRNKMRQELDKSKNALFDLKQGPGGIVDIEFMVQYGVLAWAHAFPALVEYTDNIRILEALEKAALMTPEQVRLLGEAYRAYRGRLHRMALLEQKGGLVECDEYQEHINGVQSLWRDWMEDR